MDDWRLHPPGHSFYPRALSQLVAVVCLVNCFALRQYLLWLPVLLVSDITDCCVNLMRLVRKFRGLKHLDVAVYPVYFVIWVVVRNVVLGVEVLFPAVWHLAAPFYRLKRYDLTFALSGLAIQASLNTFWTWGSARFSYEKYIQGILLTEYATKQKESASVKSAK